MGKFTGIFADEPPQSRFRGIFGPDDGEATANPYNDEGASWGENPQPDWRDVEAAETAKALGVQTQEQGYRGNILPFQIDEGGRRSFAVPDLIYNPATLPGDVYAGKVGTKGEMADRAAGFVPGSGLRGVRPSIIRRVGDEAPKVSKELPTTQSLKNMGSALYKEADDAGLRIAAPSYGRLVAGLTHTLKKEGVDPTLHPGATAAIRRLIGEIPKDVPPGAMSKLTGVKGKVSSKAFTLEEIDTLRKVIGAVRRSKDPARADDRRLAGIMADRIDEWLGALGPGDVVAGDAVAASNSIRAARSIWARVKKAELLDEAHERALDKAGANYTNAGLQTALRQEFKRIKNNKALFRSFTKQEQAVITSIVRGASAENLLRWAGKFAPSSPLSTAITIFTGGYGAGLGVPGALALMGAGEVAARTSARMGQKKVNRLNALVRRGYDNVDEGL